jgi:hypothetical protein
MIFFSSSINSAITYIRGNEAEINITISIIRKALSVIVPTTVSKTTYIRTYTSEI